MTRGVVRYCKAGNIDPGETAHRRSSYIDEDKLPCI